MLTHRSLFLAVVVFLAVFPSKVMACAVCFGAADAYLTKGLNAGILCLLFIILFVLGGFIAFIVHLARHSKKNSIVT